MSLPNTPRSLPTLSPLEQRLHAQGFEYIPQGQNYGFFRRFFRVRDLQPLWIARLVRMGARPEDEMSVCYNESGSIVSACILNRHLYLEYDLAQPEAGNLLWGARVEGICGSMRRMRPDED